ncbi:hypothetical protein [Allobranchiibius sp. GilTou73]|uniref:hypothetical protein n=1 Tax=Allobranchiibius sp. GilTou73 TaxID=2904523 RepID=UPI001F1CEE88|nr:hypothetical protein [Allobranchiibius sp. GilTou73]UIJ35251.1 hypothetical protein LVQ62_02355 [Allobranchiibius sp. GilTou73]
MPSFTGVLRPGDFVVALLFFAEDFGELDELELDAKADDSALVAEDDAAVPVAEGSDAELDPPPFATPAMVPITTTAPMTVITLWRTNQLRFAFGGGGGAGGFQLPGGPPWPPCPPWPG